jgi:hypothetical protein
VALYVDDDPLWGELPKGTRDVEKFLEGEWHRVPVALRCDVTSGLGLAAFLTAVHGFADQSAPGMAVWENRTHADQPYVCIRSARPGGGNGIEDKIRIYYCALPDALIVTLSEDLLKRAIERRAKPAGGTEPAKAAEAVRPWLGASLAARVDGNALPVIEALTREARAEVLRLRSWDNIPILDEWRRLFPGEDPVRVHEKRWGVTLLCPGGGKYVWNDAWRTMESTAFGHPGEPREAAPAGPLADVRSAEFGISFESGGLRARAVIGRKAR